MEIDESKFGERKHNRGHRVEGCWVFGGVELTPERRFFAVVVPDRSADTLMPIIQAHIAPGSIIGSDHWKAHDIIPFVPGHDCVHKKVNPSKEFVSEDGAHTNTIEGTWSGIKRIAPVAKRTKKSLPGGLFEFIFRRRNQGNLWNGLLQAPKDVSHENLAKLKWCFAPEEECQPNWLPLECVCGLTRQESTLISQGQINWLTAQIQCTRG